MIRLNRHTILTIVLSLIIIISGFYFITFIYAGVTESYSTIKNSREIQNNPEVLKKEIVELNNHKLTLQSQLDRIENKKQPNLEMFSEISKEYNVKLTGVHLKSQSVLKADQGKRYQLIYSGRLTSVLNALDYMESNLIIAFESIALYQNEGNKKHVDINMTLSFPE